MKCPYCGYIEDRVIDSRPTDEGRHTEKKRMFQMPEKIYHL